MVTNEDRWQYLKWRKQELERKKHELNKEKWEVDDHIYNLKQGHITQDFDNLVIAYLMNTGQIKLK